MKILLVENKNNLIAMEKGVFSFINLYSLNILINSRIETGFSYGVDGALLCLVLKYLYKIKVNRLSFDFTSIADEVFKVCEMKEKPIAIIGGNDLENKNFINKITKLYPKLHIVYSHDGYFKDRKKMCASIINSKAEIVLIGLGSQKQDSFSKQLVDASYTGTVFTCGGFISQTARQNNSVNYYPEIIKKLKMRALYRFVKETHTRKRYIFDYPSCILKLLINKFTNRIKFEINK